MIKPKLQAFEPPHLLTLPLSNYLSGRRADDLARLRSQLPKQYSIYIMGGLLRNLLLRELRQLPLRNADIDLVVQGARSSHELREHLRDYCFRKNEFGGAKCRISSDGDVFDIWRIEDHVGMSSVADPPTIEQLLKHNLLDVDAILLDVQTEMLYDYGCLDAIEAGKISLLGCDGISTEFVAAQVSHVILTALKTGFDLSDIALQFIGNSCEDTATKGEVVRIARRKAPELTPQVDEFLNTLVREELWPMATT